MAAFAIADVSVTEGVDIEDHRLPGGAHPHDEPLFLKEVQNVINGGDGHGDSPGIQNLPDVFGSGMGVQFL